MFNHFHRTDNIIPLWFRQQGFGRCIQVRKSRGQFGVRSCVALRNGNVRRRRVYAESLSTQTSEALQLCYSLSGITG